MISVIIELLMCDVNTNILLTVSKPARYFSLNVFEGNSGLFINFFVSVRADFPTSQDWSQPLSARQVMADVARGNDVKDVRKRKRTERETGVERKGVLVSRICRDTVAFCLDFLFFSLFVAALDAFPTLNVAISRPGTETQQSAVFVGAFRNSWDKCCWFYLFK